MKQEHIGVNFHQTILMALADEGHVEKAIKTAFKFHVEKFSFNIPLLLPNDTKLRRNALDSSLP